MLERAGFRVETPVFRAVAEMLETLRAEDPLPHPWPELKERAESEGATGILILGYGSLVNASSASKTLTGDTVSTSLPIVGFGAKRLFNYDMPLLDRYGPPHEPRSNAALNAEATSDPMDLVNGVCISIPLGELDAFRKRELGYDLARVPCLDWADPSGRPFPAWILCCPADADLAARITSRDLLPHHKYYRVCRTGAEVFGDRFLRLWLETTYLADGITPVAEWETPEVIEEN
jgi:hypothetical protein